MNTIINPSALEHNALFRISYQFGFLFYNNPRIRIFPAAIFVQLSNQHSNNKKTITFKISLMNALRERDWKTKLKSFACNFPHLDSTSIYVGISILSTKVSYSLSNWWIALDLCCHRRLTLSYFYFSLLFNCFSPLLLDFIFIFFYLFFIFFFTLFFPKWNSVAKIALCD